MAWSDMAVVVRAGQGTFRVYGRRSAAGSRSKVPASDLPLGQDPALAPLLIGLQLADRPEEVSVGVTGSSVLRWWGWPGRRSPDRAHFRLPIGWGRGQHNDQFGLSEPVGGAGRRGPDQLSASP